MIGLLGIGAALLLGIGVRIAGYSGIALFAMMYTATALLPENNPLLDEHVVYAIALLVLIAVDSGQYLGLGGIWRKTTLVRRFSILW